MFPQNSSVLTCQCTRSAAELGVVFVSTVSCFYNQLAVGEVRIVHTIVLNLVIIIIVGYDTIGDKQWSLIMMVHLEVLHHNVDTVLRLAVPVAAPADVVASIRGLSSVNGQGVVKQNPHSGASVQWVAVLQPGYARSHATVDVAGNADVGVDGEPCL